MKYTFSNTEHIRTARSRVVIFHGTRDTVVPMSSAERLKPLLATPADFIVVPGGGHRNLSSFPQYQEGLKSLLEAPGF
jgi:pimeloyl-ACP methyl ester carboxylesterase